MLQTFVHPTGVISGSDFKTVKIYSAVSESSRRAFAAIIGGLTARGAQGVILGCTEIGLLVRPGDTSARLFDTTEIHARRAALYALGEAVPRDGGE